MKRLLIVPAAGLAVALGAAVPASAAGNDGAQTTHDSQCWTLSDGTQVCGVSTTVDNTTVTPSGMISSIIIGHYDLTYTLPSGYSFSDAGSVQSHVLYRQGETQESSEHLSRTYSLPGGGSCTFYEDLVFVNGRYVFQNSGGSCTT